MDKSIISRLRALTDLTPGVTAIADESLFQEAADELEKRMPEHRVMLGVELMQKMNEWKDAGGSDTDVLIALMDLIELCIERSADDPTCVQT